MTEFFQTRMGQTHYESTMPRLVRALEHIAASAERIADARRPPDTGMRWRFQHRGAHVHVRVFTRTNDTYAKTGDLVFSDTEWPTLVTTLVGIEVLPDDDLNGGA